jgi:hypothetical protein
MYFPHKKEENRLLVKVTRPVWFETKEILYNGDDAGIEAGGSSKGNSNIQYRWTSLDTSFDNDILLRSYTLGPNPLTKQASLPTGRQPYPNS